MTFEEILPYLKKGEKIRRDLNKNLYFYFKNQTLYNNLGNVYDFTYSELTANDWEVYEEPIDWNYIIEHKCLCWFWDENYERRLSGILVKIDKNRKSRFYYNHLTPTEHLATNFKNCEPIKKSEVCFYEDKDK